MGQVNQIERQGVLTNDPSPYIVQCGKEISVTVFSFEVRISFSVLLPVLHLSGLPAQGPLQGPFSFWCTHLPVCYIASLPSKKVGPWILICLDTWQDAGGKFSL